MFGRLVLKHLTFCRGAFPLEGRHEHPQRVLHTASTGTQCKAQYVSLSQYVKTEATHTGYHYSDSGMSALGTASS